MNEKLVIDPISKNFVFARIVGVFALVVLLAFVVISGKTMSESRAQDLYYDPSDLSMGIVIKDSDKSAFENLTEKDIEKQFNDVVGNLNINKINYTINTRNIGVNDPFKEGSTPGNKYIDKDIKEAMNASKSHSGSAIY